MGDFFEIGVGKPYKIRAEDSEKLLEKKGGKITWKYREWLKWLGFENALEMC